MSQDLWSVSIRPKYVRRSYRNRLIVRRTGTTDSFVNGADYHAHSYTLQLDNRTPWILGLTQWNTSIATDFLKTDRSDLARAENPNEQVILNGQQMTRARMEREINSGDEQWVTRLGLDMDIPDWGITWANKVYIKAPVKQTEELTTPTGATRAYKTIDYGTHVQWDTRLRYHLDFYQSHNAYVQFDVRNLLNRKRKSGTLRARGAGDYGLYSPGRELWVEVGYGF